MNPIISSKEQTKEWRKNQTWYKDGKHNECEKYQQHNIEQYLHTSLSKTHLRLNTRTGELKKHKQPNKQSDGFDWTEDFDFQCVLKNKHLLFNCKMVCDSGGAQNRTLREVYTFIDTQYKYLLKNQHQNSIYFINILEGDACYNDKDKFTSYLSELTDHVKLKNRVFIGDFMEFVAFYNQEKIHNLIQSCNDVGHTYNITFTSISHNLHIAKMSGVEGNTIGYVQVIDSTAVYHDACNFIEWMNTFHENLNLNFVILINDDQIEEKKKVINEASSLYKNLLVISHEEFHQYMIDNCGCF